MSKQYNKEIKHQRLVAYKKRRKQRAKLAKATKATKA
jgi:hypothetical protein